MIYVIYEVSNVYRINMVGVFSSQRHTIMMTWSGGHSEAR